MNENGIGAAGYPAWQGTRYEQEIESNRHMFQISHKGRHPRRSGRLGN